MKGLPGLPPAAGRSPVVAQLSDHQLAQRVSTVGRIESAAVGLLACFARVLERLFAEHRFRFGDAHPACVQADGG